MDWPDEQYAAQDDRQTTVVGLMSDTHGVLDKRVLQAFRDEGLYSPAYRTLCHALAICPPRRWPGAPVTA